MTLSSRHRIRNSSPGGLRPNTLPLGHGGSPQYWLSHVNGEDTFFVSFTAGSGNQTPNSGVKGSGVNHYPRAPAPQFTANTGLSPNVGTMLAHFLRRWPNIVPTLGERPVFVGKSLFSLADVKQNYCVSYSFKSKYRGEFKSVVGFTLRDLVKLTESKNPRKTRIGQTTPTHPLYI